jgi:tRNA(fMet)-specific endonuclease VapC
MKSPSADLRVYFLDTNVVIFALNKRKPAIDARLRCELTMGTPLLISTVVLFELRYGVARSDRREQSERVLNVFLADNFEIAPFDADDAAEAGALRGALAEAGTPIGPYDLLIAAQARRRGARLVTDNAKEFERVPELAVESWG